ncbi:hypothetical protein ACJ72_02546 [Emergomyces africanus]|uniref:UBL3-like ubiquitin domain-containing protein n=1 Tax=Emergomyces africanus TaxID=1955775 RepID=A0A1B7P249_9EURO|nr:hypothetical protein ACJ72_02546 [Emergomyces africanus]
MASSITAIPDPSPQSQLEDVEKSESPLALSKSGPSSTPQGPPDSMTMTTTTTTTPLSAPVPESDTNNATDTTTMPSPDPDPAITTAMDPSHLPATIDPTESTEPTEHSEPSGASTTIGENAPTSLISQPPETTASQLAPPTATTTTTTTTNTTATTTANNEPLQQQTQSTAHSACQTEEPKPCDPAIGPSSDAPSPTGKEAEDSGMVLDINLLLITGARHPFKIDGKYLRKRQVDVPDSNPYAMSVYTLKELIWREWRSEWEPRPSSPSSIRLISFGKLLEDKAPLSDLRLNHTAPNVLHMTLKPQEVVDEEDAKAARSTSGRERDSGDHSPRCRCVIL